ncbi:membrane bound O-acyl transferase MBOAT family protein [Paenibacillus curdlanolyticus YK9]|uniref:Membrane bound O-acyl transferase MBOAT family protein n=1 Tax=Paenibacillus curdlanolyticus YK9 TaxID=717606 RepID=E0I9R9_9BACL|nr:MBOAT family O-acyltransferase [Paenibacillus curdlanolyticus]EFM11153.1 membrane bound O-acyl transferase MBOAT family protein [Paenibacillus curdlanolyticus YK9]
MLFNSPSFIFIYLPIVLTGYFLLNAFQSVRASRAWLAACSLFFYGCWNPNYLPLILASIAVNFIIGRLLILKKQKKLLIIGIIFNLGLLGYFKYFDFLLTNINALLSTHAKLLDITLPLAISFFTFQQISYLVDCYKGKVTSYNFINYTLFITFFPHLIAGPIVHHKVMMPQFQNKQNLKINMQNIALGVMVFTIGLFKKVVLADQFSTTVSDGMNQLGTITFFDAWTVILSYSFQLYFDFSGYSDMAIGIALLFNIKLPNNFHSPFKATNFQDLVSRWHMTLTRFLYEYVYFPLNRYLTKNVFSHSLKKLSMSAKTAINLMLLFLMSGIWHGAGWNFIIWGLLLGSGIVISRWWSSLKIKLPIVIAWVLTFGYMNLTLIFFRISDLDQALLLLKAVLGLNGFILPEQLSHFLRPLSAVGMQFAVTPLMNKFHALGLIAIGFIIVLGFKNTSERMENFKPKLTHAFFIAIVLVYSILNLTKASAFLYFKF